MAVPSPSKTLPSSHHAKFLVSTVTKIPAAWTHMPATMRPLRPQRSLKRPVTTCRTPHTAGYAAFKIPMRLTSRPKVEKKSGKTPQLIPSLRLLTKPAWEAAKRLRSLKEVLEKTSRKFEGSDSDEWDSISSRTCSPVSRTRKIEMRRPKKT